MGNTSDSKYPMHTKEGVETFLLNYSHLKEMLYFSSDYDALIMLIDFDKALIESSLSEMELVVINLVFIEDLKRVDVALLFGVTKQTVQKWVERALTKLAKYYKGVGEGIES